MVNLAKILVDYQLVYMVKHKQAGYHSG